MKKPRFVSVLLSLSLAAVGLAQGRPAPNIARNGAYVVQLTPVQIELKLTQDQAHKVRESLESFGKQQMSLYQQLGASVTEEQAQQTEAQVDKLAETCWTKVGSVLNDVQSKRLRQLVLQSMGYEAMLTDSVRQDLGLTASQIKELAVIDAAYQEQNDDISSDMSDALQKLPKGTTSLPASSMKAFNDRMANLRTQAETKALAVLTSEQKAKWNQMLGPKFDFKPSRKG